SSDNTFVNCRADDNQGHGWVIDGAFSHYLGCRAFADGQDADGTYDAFLVNGNGNDFNFCQVNNFGYGGSPPSPLYNRYKHAFETMNANTTEPNRFMNERVATYACTSDVFKFSGSQVNNPNFDLTAFDPIGRRTARFRCDLSVWDDAYTHVKTTGPSNEKVWETRLNYGSGFSELVHGVLSDDYLTEVLYMFVLRLGTVIKNIQFQNADKMTVSGMPLNTDTITISASHLLQFLATTGIVLAGSGSPEGVVSAVGGSLYLDGNGHLYIKVAGTGNTGWSLAVTAADVLVVTQGGTGVNTLTANGVVIGEGTSPVHATGAGTAGQVLTSNGAGVDPSFQALPAGPTVDVNSELTAQASGNLTCTTSYADISGLSVTLNKNGVWRIEASLDLSFDSSAFQMSAQLVVNGVAQTGIILAIISSAGATTLSFEGLFTRSWYYTNSGSNVAKMQAKSAVASGSRSVIAANSYMSAVFLHS
ncbi:MAG TPA: hypothetical protein VNH18_06960, partial [Bryobacteraceae bacterium]|nr:hypothetical protein [Bryobacteraceae bacterium]